MQYVPTHNSRLLLHSLHMVFRNTYIDLRYPVRKFDPRRRDAPAPRLEGMRDIRWRGNNANAASDLLENAPEPRKQWAGKRLVHFNIELSNSEKPIPQLVPFAW